MALTVGRPTVIKIQMWRAMNSVWLWHADSFHGPSFVKSVLMNDFYTSPNHQPYVTEYYMIILNHGVPQPFLSMGRYSDVGSHPTHPYSFSFNFKAPYYEKTVHAFCTGVRRRFRRRCPDVWVQTYQGFPRQHQRQDWGFPRVDSAHEDA